MSDEDTLGKAPKAKVEPGLPPEVKFPNKVFLTIRSNLNCELDIAAQMTLQPEKIDEQKLKMQLMQ